MTTILLLTGLAVFAQKKNVSTHFSGQYSAQLLFKGRTSDREAASIVASTSLMLGLDDSFKLTVVKTRIVGHYEISGRFLILHLQFVDGVDAKRARGAELSNLDHVYEISNDGNVLAFVNAEPNSAALKFVKHK